MSLFCPAWKRRRKRSGGASTSTGADAPIDIDVVHGATSIVGGAQELAFKLKVTPSHLSLWMGGLEPCPGDVFLKAVDVVLESEMRAQRASEA
jgi:hypothetical protein